MVVWIGLVALPLASRDCVEGKQFYDNYEDLQKILFIAGFIILNLDYIC